MTPLLQTGPSDTTTPCCLVTTLRTSYFALDGRGVLRIIYPSCTIKFLERYITSCMYSPTSRPRARRGLILADVRRRPRPCPSLSVSWAHGKWKIRRKGFDHNCISTHAAAGCTSRSQFQRRILKTIAKMRKTCSP